jgi:hypothetical protein
MASKNYLAQINIAMVGALDTVPTGYVGFSAKSDGLYMKRPGWGDSKILASFDIGVTVSEINHTHAYDNYVSWDVSFEGGAASQIYNTRNASSYKGVNFIGQGGLTIAGSSNVNGFLNVVITAPESSYTHPAYTTFNPTLTGAIVLASLTTNTIGSVTAITTRTLTLANLGYTGATNATYYTGFGVYVGGTLQYSVGSAGYMAFVANNSAGDPTVILTTVPASYRMDIAVTGIPNCTLTGYTAGSIGVIAATDSIKVAFSKVQSSLIALGAPIWVALSSQTNNSTTSMASTGLTASLNTNTVYDFEVILQVSTATATSGINFSYTYSGIMSVENMTITGATANYATVSKPLYINAAAGPFCTTASIVVPVIIKGKFWAQTAGTVTIQFSKPGSGTASVLSGSYMKIIKIS